jgi:hypothetical protein
MPMVMSVVATVMGTDHEAARADAAAMARRGSTVENRDPVGTNRGGPNRCVTTEGSGRPNYGRGWLGTAEVAGAEVVDGPFSVSSDCRPS